MDQARARHVLPHPAEFPLRDIRPGGVASVRREAGRVPGQECRRWRAAAQKVAAVPAAATAARSVY